MTAITPTASNPSLLARARAWLRDSKIPPVYGILVIIFIAAILLDAVFGIDDQLFIFNQTILTNILVRSVALGIVAVGQTFVMLGASIDLSVAYMISVTAVGASYDGRRPGAGVVDGAGAVCRRLAGRALSSTTNFEVPPGWPP